ncbi:unnamed protein product [Camellia sinensis]
MNCSILIVNIILSLKLVFKKYETASAYSIVDAVYASVHRRSDAVAKAASSEKTAILSELNSLIFQIYLRSICFLRY